MAAMAPTLSSLLSRVMLPRGPLTEVVGCRAVMQPSRTKAAAAAVAVALSAA